ncbi:MAG: TetR/AcrR family transcriptional regulator [Actinobacteria bacterium]|nr:TetR family transcriptional regulator [Actinomycetota bacterium]MCB8997205.1 TetR/AcrR family transcriptional regulator [Actinomycetota bacterium]MCB9414655.1 TetR/AcrR family transcriptional regulator [Actinomycetota bacterium]MCB9423521.1 TetR/AcrR family transcriptional regulator [Actinomycetota bacterium]HRY10103.1 TetR/AcrR family transcriptional regulator [Candidatus Nanopelagicales bacterium]
MQEVSQARARGVDTRERLLSAAGEAFASRGFHATTTRDIAATAGMSPAAVYVHHQSKEELLYLIALEGHQQTLALVTRAISEHTEPAEQLRTAVRAYVTFHVEEHAIARVINYELVSLTDEHRREIDALRRAIRHKVQSVVVRGVADGSFDTPDPKMAAMAILSLGIDIARWHRVEASWPARRIVAFYTDLALRIVGRTS